MARRQHTGTHVHTGTRTCICTEVHTEVRARECLQGGVHAGCAPATAAAAAAAGGRHCGSAGGSRGSRASCTLVSASAHRRMPLCLSKQPSRAPQLLCTLGCRCVPLPPTLNFLFLSSLFCKLFFVCVSAHLCASALPGHCHGRQPMLRRQHRIRGCGCVGAMSCSNQRGFLSCVCVCICQSPERSNLVCRVC